MSDVEGSHRARVEAPIAACLALLRDFERYPGWYETIDAVTVLERGPEGTRLRCAAAAGPLGSVEFELLMETSETGVAGSQVGGDGKVEHVTMTWTLEPLGDAATLVDFAFSADARGRATRLALRAARPLVERDLVREPVEALRRTLEARS